MGIHYLALISVHCQYRYLKTVGNYHLSVLIIGRLSGHYRYTIGSAISKTIFTLSVLTIGTPSVLILANSSVLLSVHYRYTTPVLISGTLLEHYHYIGTDHRYIIGTEIGNTLIGTDIGYSIGSDYRIHCSVHYRWQFRYTIGALSVVISVYYRC